MARIGFETKRPVASPNAVEWREILLRYVAERGGLNSLQLSLGQRIQLEMAAFVPQPGVGVGDAAHLDRRGKR